MAQRPRNRYRWPIVLAEALLLQGLLAAAAHSADSAGTADAAVADAGSYAAGIGAGDGDGEVAVGGNDLYLEVSLNGADNGLAHFSDRDGELWASEATLRRLGFSLPAETTGLVRLNSLRGVIANYDQTTQQAAISVPIDELKLPVTVLNAPTNSVPKATSSAGLLLNYDLYATGDAHGSASLSAFTELRAFNAAGVLSSTQLSRLGIDAGDALDTSVRLDTSWSHAFPDDMLTLRMGDTLTDYVAWSRSTRIAGVQLSRNFSLQPYRITTPLPAFLGTAAVPSDIELYVNGLRQYSGQVPAGPFQLTTMPNINGAGNAQVVVTDALGRATTLNFSLYDSHQLLQRGLSDWSAELGVVREDYGVRSFAYGHDAVGSGTWRYGVTDTFTAQAHGEVTQGLVNAGGGGALQLGQAGVVSGSVAHSQYRGVDGSQFSLGYDWRSDHFNFALNGIRTSGEYRDVASLYGSPLPRLSGRASIGYNTDTGGSFGVSYLHLRYPEQAPTRFANVYWFKSMGSRLTLNLSANQNLDDRRDRSVFFGATLALGHYTTASAGLGVDRDRTTLTAQTSRSLPTEGGIGWRADVRASDGQNGGQAELDYLGPYGRLDVGAQAFASNGFIYGGASGALVWLGDHAFAARRIDDAFAVISTDGVPDVPVKLENRLIGTTDANGMLLVTPLNAYQDNQLAIDPMQLPADMRIDRVRATATPSDRAGTLVRFGITPIRAASIILQDGNEKPLPLGSEVRVNGKDGGALVGFDGAVYVDTLEKRNTLEVTTPAGHCRAQFDYPGAGNDIPQIGPLTCVAEQP